MNLGNDAIQAIQELRHSVGWAFVRSAVHAQAVNAMNNAIQGPIDTRADAGGYARALRDLCVAFEAATFGKPHQQVEKIGVDKPAPAEVKPVVAPAKK